MVLMNQLPILLASNSNKQTGKTNLNSISYYYLDEYGFVQVVDANSISEAYRIILDRKGY